MNKLSSRIWVSSFGAALVVSVLPGCTTTVYDSSPPPQQPQVVFVPTPPPDNPPPPPPEAVEPPPAPVVVIAIRAESDFYEPLGHYGRWVDVNGYGHCWVPGDVDHDWRPYTQGCWQRTDTGWYWASDEPWGWATCHYGRWFYDPALGWAWVPQTQWAPAWVAWRDGDDYTGWAPLPPRARLRADGELERPDDDVDPRSFVFVEHRRMLEKQQPRTVIVNNVTVIQKTVNITKITVVNKTVIDEGPRPDTIARATGHTVNIVPARSLRTQHEAPAIARDHLQTRVVQVSAPAPGSGSRNPPEARGNEGHNPRPIEPVPPQHVVAPEPRPPQQPAQPIVLSNPNRPPQPQPEPAPHPINPDQKRNGQYYFTNRPPQHQPVEIKPVTPPHPNRVETEPPHPVQPVKPPEHQPEHPQHQPPMPAAPPQPRPEPNAPGRPAGQHENEGNQPAQHEHGPQPKPEQHTPQKGNEKPHPGEDKNHHSSTNAPPQRRE